MDSAREFLLGRNARPKQRGNTTLVFSGEEYPEPRTIQSLKERGHQFKAGPSYLVHLYEEDAPFPKSLNGRFQGLVATALAE